MLTTIIVSFRDIKATPKAGSSAPKLHESAIINGSGLISLKATQSERPKLVFAVHPWSTAVGSLSAYSVVKNSTESCSDVATRLDFLTRANRT